MHPMLEAGTVNFPDTGKYKEKREQHVRNELAIWVAYAENGPSYDPDGVYKCGTCDMRSEPDKCTHVEGKICMDDGSCRLYIHGPELEGKPPLKHKLTQIQAQYSENPGGFGCHKCEYQTEAKQVDGSDRHGWCTFWGVHVQLNACCSMFDSKSMQAGGPGSGRHKGDYTIDKVDHPMQTAQVTYKGQNIGSVQQVTAKTGQLRWDANHNDGTGFREKTRQDVVESMIDHHLAKGIKAGGPGSGRHKEISDAIKAFIKKDGRTPYDINDGDCRDVALHVKTQVPEARVMFDPIHTFIEHKGMYYDAERPDGVNNMEDLPMFKGEVIDKSMQRELTGKYLRSATETALTGDQQGSLWNGIRIIGFTGPEEEGLKAMMSRIPPELLYNVKELKAAPYLDAKHGRFIPETKTVLFNPKNFSLRQRFGQGDNWIYHAELTVVHEIGHSIYESFYSRTSKGMVVIRWLD